MGYTSKLGNPHKLVLATIPTTDLTDALDVWVYGEPNVLTGELPYIATDTYFEPVLYGAMGRMYGKSDKPWTDLAQAAFNLRKFRNLTTEARGRANRGYTGNAQNWVFPSFGR
jgi:hypothetical protein